MKVMIINIHSLVDVITNSSTELFISDTSKTVDEITKIIHLLIEKYNLEIAEKGELIDGVSYPLKTNWDAFIPPIIVNKENHEVVEQAFDNACWGVSFTKEERLKEQRIAHINWTDKDINQLRNKQHRDSALIKNDIERANTYKKNEKNINSLIELKYLKYKQKQPEWWNKKSDSGSDFSIEELSGKLLIFGSEDNSIPYLMFDLIAKTFNANVYHLG